MSFIINSYAYSVAGPYIPNTYEWVPIGDPDNPDADTSAGDYGAVNYEYDMSKYAVRQADIDEFNNSLYGVGVYTLSGNVGTFNISSPEVGNAYHFIKLNSSGTVLVTGAVTDRDIKVYEHNGGTSWSKRGADIGPTANQDGRGRHVDINAVGNRIVFSDPLYDGDGFNSNTGRVFVYEWSGSQWDPLGPDFVGASNDEVGDGVAINAVGDRVAFACENGSYAQVHEWSGSQWIQMGPDISGNATRVGLNQAGNRLVVSFDATSIGSVKVYEWSGSQWIQMGPTLSTGYTNGRFGRSVDINADGDIIAVGGYADGVNTTSDEGFVHVYQWSGTAWNQLGNSEINGDFSNEFYGCNVALNAAGTQVVVGSQQDEVAVYAWTGSYWYRTQLISPGGASEGITVTCSSDGTVIGVAGFNSSGANIYQRESQQIVNPTPHASSNAPMTNVSWNEAARFVNWLNIREGYLPAYKFTTNGINDDKALWTVSDDGYNPNNLFRNISAVYMLPSEDEWVKAAYYDPNKSGGAGYYQYPLSSDSPPQDVLNGTDPGTAVFDGTTVTPTIPADVDDSGGLSPFGTMGQGGNSFEWMETALDNNNNSPTDPCNARGGSWSAINGIGSLNIDSRTTVNTITPSTKVSSTGFRIARKFETYTWNLIGDQIIAGEFQDRFGEKIDINAAGDIVAATSTINSDGGLSAGEVRIFQNSGGTWSQVGGDIEGTTGEGAVLPPNGFSPMSVAINGPGDMVVTGWPGNDDTATDSGQVRVYRNVSNTWTLTGGVIDNFGFNNRLGTWEGVDINTDGNIVAVAAWLGGDTGDISDPGEVKVYEMNAGGTAWQQLGQTLSGETTGVDTEYQQEADYFGWSVSLNGDGDILAVGAWSNDNNDYPNKDRAGHVRVFELVGGTWTQIGSDIDGGVALQLLGYSTCLNLAGDIVAIGGYGSPNNGVVRIYENVSGTWTQIGSDITGETANDVAGYTVSLNGAGDIVVVGDVLHDSVGGTNTGRFRAFKNIGGTWTQLGYDVRGTAPADYFSTSVAINSAGDIIASGTPYSDIGYVKVYEGGYR